SQPSPPRSRTRGQRTATGPMPVMISRSGRCPWRTNRRRPSSVSLSAWQLSKLETSASTACARSARAPLRKTSVSGSVKVPGCESWKTLVSVTAYHSFAGEVEASNTPTIRRLTPSRRHQLSPIAQPAAIAIQATLGVALSAPSAVPALGADAAPEHGNGEPDQKCPGELGNFHLVEWGIRRVSVCRLPHCHDGWPVTLPPG